MTNRTIAVIGGGPAGLAAARLIKIFAPESSVTVYERAGSNADTFGFGVGLTEATMRNLAAADPETAETIRQASYAGHHLVLRTADRDVELHGARNLAISRATLLRVLSNAAKAVGVEVCLGRRIDAGELDADVVVAADGAHSATRDALADELGVQVTFGDLRYMWCGADFAVDTAYFTAHRSGAGLFVAHAYPYEPGRSTFLIEADPTTWQVAGLAENAADLASGETDAVSVAMLERVFNAELGGRGLLTNRTRWAQFPTVALNRWSTGNVVVVGDAAHTAHYTIGSGTKLALEDGIALGRALAEHQDIPEAFAAYEAARRPPVERFKYLAARSHSWWSSYRQRIDQTPDQIALSYMTRAGNLSIADYATEYPDTVVRALDEFGIAPVDRPQDLDQWLLSRPLHHQKLTVDRRELSEEQLAAQGAVQRIDWGRVDAWGIQHESALADAVPVPADIAVLSGKPDLAEVGARIDFAERLRWATGKVVVVELPAAARAMGAAAIATHRAHAVSIRD